MFDHNLILFAIGSVFFGLIYGLIFHYNYILVRIDGSLTLLFLILGMLTFLIIRVILSRVFKEEQGEK